MQTSLPDRVVSHVKDLFPSLPWVASAPDMHVYHKVQQMSQICISSRIGWSPHWKDWTFMSSQRPPPPPPPRHYWVRWLL